MNSITRINPSLQLLLKELKKNIHAHYGDRLHSVVLFGSYARNEAHKASDIDVLVLLKDPKVSVFHEIDHLVNITYPILLDHEHLISAIPASVHDYEAQKSPLFLEAKKEGVLL